MPAPYDFPSATPFQGLPLLFAGQAQKEFFVNQALSLIDALLQHSVVSSLDAPPNTVSDGEAFRILAPASAEWIGEEDSLAVSIGGAWHFVRPNAGMMIFDQQHGQHLVFTTQWEAASSPATPNGGSVVDVEARAAINHLIQELERLGFML